MAPSLASLVREQPWFDSMTTAHLSLVTTLLDADRAAAPRGERDSVVAALRFATQQPWYRDGLTEEKAIGLRGVFKTYAASLSDRRAPQIGPVLASTLAYELFEVVELPESGSIILLASAEDAWLGRRALDLTVRWLPEIENTTGAFPYTFLHMTVTELPELFAGLSYDEFIALAPAYVDDETVIHELTHSTLYGIFPTWFEEGFAHFMEYYLTDALEDAAAYFEGQLERLGFDRRLNVGPKPGYSFDNHLADRATGFLFVKGLYELQGIDEVVATIRSLRSRTFTDQQLIRELVNQTAAERRQELRAFVCENVIGTTHNYCAPLP